MKRNTKLWLSFAIVFMCLFGCSGILFYVGIGPIDFEPSSRNLDTAAVDYRNAGWPWVASEVDNRPPIPSGEDAGVEVHEALDLLNDQAVSKLGPRTDRYGIVKDPQVESVLKSSAKALALAVKASAKKGVRFNRDWDLGPYLLFPEFAKFKALVRLLTWRADNEGAAGDVKGACRDLMAAEKMSDFSGQDPNLISGLVRIACDSIVLTGFENCAAMLGNDPSALGQLRAALIEPPAVDFPFHLRCEAYNGLAILRNVDLYGGIEGLMRMFSGGEGESLRPLDPARLRRTGLPNDLLSRAFLDKSLAYWAQYGATMKTYRNDPEAVGAKMDVVEKQAENEHSLSNFLNAILCPVFSQAGVAFKEDGAKWIVARAFFAAMTMRAQTGHFPSRIEDLPGQWIDPFTGKPLKIRNANGEFRIYSLGRWRKDVGGRSRSERPMRGFGTAGFNPAMAGGSESDDYYNIVFAYPPVKGSV